MEHNRKNPLLMIEVLQKVALSLDFAHIQRCKSVCKLWRDALSQATFWKRYVPLNYDFDEKEGSSDWLDYWTEDRLFFYLEGDPVVFQKFPKHLNCGIIVPADFECQNVQNGHEDLARAIYILNYITERTNHSEYIVSAYGNEGDGDVMPVLIPWKEQWFPNMNEVMNMFTVSPKVYNSDIDFECTPNLTFQNWFSTFTSYNDYDDSDAIDELRDDEKVVIKDDRPFPKPSHLCAYRLKKRNKSGSGMKECKDLPVSAKGFARWCGRIFQPSYMFYGGEESFNPVLFFHLTTLSNGYVGGVMSNITMT